MKNRDIHKGLDKAEIRDFLAERLLKSAIECRYTSTEFIQSHIDELQVQLNHAKTLEAIQQRMLDNGWTDYDVTEEIEDYDNTKYIPFIGTAAEYEKQLHPQMKGLSSLLVCHHYSEMINHAI